MDTAGGLDGQGRWCEPRKNRLLPRQVLTQMFRDREADEGGGGGGRRRVVRLGAPSMQGSIADPAVFRGSNSLSGPSGVGPIPLWSARWSAASPTNR
jgi:hypothetical protein